MNEFAESREVKEWNAQFVWFDVSQVDLDNEELHWSKITPETARESFDALSRMRESISKCELNSRADVLNCRDYLAGRTDESNERLFTDSDLRFFDLYFGDSRVKIDKLGGGYDVINGRHRISAAQINGIKEIPVLLNEKTAGKQKEADMSNLELSELEQETAERGEEAGEMQTAIEQHQDRAENLADELNEIRAVLAEIGSDQMREVQSKVEEAQAETKRQLEGLRERRDKMLNENTEIEQKLVQQNEERRHVREKMAKMKMMFAGASTEFKDQINQANDALAKDLERFSDAQEDLQKVRRQLEEMNFEMKS